MNAPQKFQPVCHTGNDVRAEVIKLLTAEFDGALESERADQLLSRLIREIERIIIDELTLSEAFDQIAENARAIVRAAEMFGDVPFGRSPEVIKEMGKAAREIIGVTEAECFQGQGS